jgi:HD-like signal output (HDOD) protein/CheY-like chemotaxis protein
MKRILFVDDEQRILDALQNLLRRHRKVWEMVFACGGEAALKVLAERPFDVIVSDMRMPGVDGATLLRRVQQDFPHIVRIVLSGQTEHDVSRRMVHIAHQFLAKPCDAAKLQEVIDRACNLQALLGDEKLRDLVGQIGQLPVKPRIYSRLVSVLEDPKASLNDAAAILERDIATSAKILQVVNSAFFGLPQRLGNVNTAVCYLGSEMVKTLVLSIEINDGLGKIAPCPGFDFDRMQQQSLLSARISRQMLPDKMSAEDAFTASMLQDVGRLVLSTRTPQIFAELVASALGDSRPLVDIERERLGVTHAEIGAYLLGIWGLPYPIVEAVANHHTPARVAATGFDVSGAVYVAHSLASELLGSIDLAPGASAIEASYLESVGVSGRLSEWRALAAREATSLGITVSGRGPTSTARAC